MSRPALLPQGVHAIRSALMSSGSSLVVGVIGHVDHGKTALVRALTGMETDRLEEERRRGISIALGFAHVTRNGRVIDLIDMPGHERFVRTMIAGATGINAVLLVVAANEGVKPQTAEHVEIAALLGLRRAVIAVSKVDLVSPDQAELAAREAMELAARNGLASDPPVLTSATTRQGIEPLLAALGALAPEIAAPADDGFCYLPIDRAFSVAGHGTVVTGTLRRGPIALGDELELVPGGRRARIRGLEVHGTRVGSALPGQRVAVNLRGIETEAAPRGLALATPGMLEPSTWLTVALRATPSAPAPLRSASTLRLLFGTSEADATVRLLDRDELAPGETCYAQLRCTPRVALPVREHFILRATSTPRTVAGGRILEAWAQRLRRHDPGVLGRLHTLEAAAPGELVRHELERAGPRGVRLPMLSRVAGLSPARVDALLRESGATLSGGVAMTPSAVARAGRAVLLLLERHWAEHKQGLTREQLLRGLRTVGGEVLDAAVHQLAERGVVQRAARIRLLRAEHEAASRAQETAAARALEEAFRRAGLTPPEPKPSDLAARRAMNQLIRDGVLIRAVDHVHKREFLFHRDAIDTARRVLTPLLRASPPGLPVSELGAALGISRKYSVPLLEHLDAIQFTRRIGDRRVLRQG